MVSFENVPPNAKILDLGGGGNRHPLATCCVDLRAEPGVDFQVDFNEPLPMSSDEWDVVYSCFALEHVSWRNLRGLLSEVFRITKPGGKIVAITPNTEAQLRWILEHPDGWDGRDIFDSASCILLGDQNYAGNFHSSYFSPGIAIKLFSDAGFTDILIQPFGNLATDMSIQATKPATAVTPLKMEQVMQQAFQETKHIREAEHAGERRGLLLKDEGGRTMSEEEALIIYGDPTTSKPQGVMHYQEDESVERARRFSKKYFDGGYYHPTYLDYSFHELTFQHIMNRKPESVLDLGAGRGYVLKRLQDQSIPAYGMDISKHCLLTRVCEGIKQHDICNVPWPINDPNCFMGSSVLRFSDYQYAADLAFSLGVLEYIPEQHLPAVIGEMQRTCKRGLHGIDYDGHEDEHNKEHMTLKPKGWWEHLFAQHAPNWPVEIFQKSELEQGQFPQEVVQGDGKLKIQLGSFTSMVHHGWLNADQHDLAAYAQSGGYRYQRMDIRHGLPFGTGVVDMLFMHHALEHLTFSEASALLKEMRRVIRKDGVVRLAVPDLAILTAAYQNMQVDLDLNDLGEMNDGVAAASTMAGKLWAMVHEGHQSCYDAETLCGMLEEAGFTAKQGKFRVVSDLSPHFKQLLAETVEMSYGGSSLFCDAIPKLG